MEQVLQQMVSGDVRDRREAIVDKWSLPPCFGGEFPGVVGAVEVGDPGAEELEEASDRRRWKEKLKLGRR